MPGLRTVTAPELEGKDIPPLQWVVKGLIAEGLTLLASPPKYGKSWMMMALCLCVARGIPFLGFETVPGEVLYISLEDSERRLQDRMRKLLQTDPPPPGFRMSTECAGLSEGFLTELDRFLQQCPRTRLVIVDTFQRLRGAESGSRSNVYAADYQDMAALKAFADSRRIALLLVHHLRKSGDEGDPFNRISGTNGLFGAADCAVVLSKSARTDLESGIHVVGRDVESMDFTVRFDREHCRWTRCEDAGQNRERQAYEHNPLVVTLRSLLRTGSGSWSGTASDLLTALRQTCPGALPDISQRGLSGRLRALEDSLHHRDGILITRISRGTSGARYCITQSEPQEPQERK